MCSPVLLLVFCGHVLKVFQVKSKKTLSIFALFSLQKLDFVLLLGLKSLIFQIEHITSIRYVFLCITESKIGLVLFDHVPKQKMNA